MRFEIGPVRSVQLKHARRVGGVGMQEVDDRVIGWVLRYRADIGGQKVAVDVDIVLVRARAVRERPGIDGVHEHEPDALRIAIARLQPARQDRRSGKGLRAVRAADDDCGPLRGLGSEASDVGRKRLAGLARQPFARIARHPRPGLGAGGEEFAPRVGIALGEAVHGSTLPVVAVPIVTDRQTSGKTAEPRAVWAAGQCSRLHMPRTTQGEIADKISLRLADKRSTHQQDRLRPQGCAAQTSAS